MLCIFIVIISIILQNNINILHKMFFSFSIITNNMFYTAYYYGLIILYNNIKNKLKVNQTVLL